MDIHAETPCYMQFKDEANENEEAIMIDEKIVWKCQYWVFMSKRVNIS